MLKHELPIQIVNLTKEVEMVTLVHGGIAWEKSKIKGLVKLDQNHVKGASRIIASELWRLLKACGGGGDGVQSIQLYF